MALLLPPFPQNDTSWVGAAVRASSQDFMRQTAFSLSMAQKMGEEISGAGQQLAKNLFDRKKMAMAADEAEHNKKMDYLKLALEQRKADSAMQNDTVRAAASMLRAARPPTPRAASAGKPGLFDGFQFPSRDGTTPAPAATPAPTEPSQDPSLPLPSNEAGPNPILPPVERREGVIPPGELYESPDDSIITRRATMPSPTMSGSAPAEGSNGMPNYSVAPAITPDRAGERAPQFVNIDIPTKPVPSVSGEAALVPAVTADDTLDELKATLGPELYNRMYLFAKGRAGGTADAKKEYFDEAAKYGANAAPYFTAMFDALSEKTATSESYAKAADEQGKMAQQRSQEAIKTREEVKTHALLSKVIIDQKFKVGQPGREQALAALDQFKKTKRPFLTQLTQTLDDIERVNKPDSPKTLTTSELTDISYLIEDSMSQPGITEEEKNSLQAQLDAIQGLVMQRGQAAVDAAAAAQAAATSAVTGAPIPAAPAAPATPASTPAALSPQDLYLKRTRR